MSLKYLAAYGLASLATASPSKDSVAKIAKAGGAFDQAEFDAAWAQLEGKGFASLVAAGQKKMSAAPSGAGAAAPAAAAGGKAPAAAGKPAAKPAAKAESEDDAGGDMGGLFD